MQTRLIFEYPDEWEERKFYPKVTLIRGGEICDSGLLGFFGLMKPSRYMLYLQAFLEKNSLNFHEYGGIVFGPQEADLWEEMTKLDEDEVLIGVWDERAKFPYKELVRHTRDFANTLVEVLQVNPNYFGAELSESIKISAHNFLRQTESSS